MGVVRNLLSMDPQTAAIATATLPSVYRLKIERTDGDLFPDPLLERNSPTPWPRLPMAGDRFDVSAWSLEAALPPPKGPYSYVVDEVIEQAFMVAGAIVIESVIGVRLLTALEVENEAELPQARLQRAALRAELMAAHSCSAPALAEVTADRLVSALVSALQGRSLMAADGSFETWQGLRDAVQINGHLLRGMALEELHRRAASAVLALPHDARLALWLAEDPDALAKDAACWTAIGADTTEPSLVLAEGVDIAASAIVARVLRTLADERCTEA